MTMNHLRRLALAACALAAPAQAQDVPLGRLPDTVKPTAYRIDLKVDPEQAEYSGHVEIDAEVTTATRSIFLHGLGLKMARADVVAGGKTLPARYAEVDASGVARLDLDGPLAAYLVAVGVGDFDVRETSIPANEVRKTPLAFRVMATKGQASRMDTTLTEAPKIATILEDCFGIPYPYEKLDFIASPVMGGAMENAGLTVVMDRCSKIELRRLKIAKVA
ncbi:hypothetical protein CAP39_01890 [Sphingomonas sp. IBVSS1]|nr:hypothetical protein CAP39_01890 [Sphingomonas sp. IBVSS1]